MKYNLLAERRTRGIPRAFVEYTTSSTTGGGDQADFQALPVDLTTQEEDAIEAFLTPDLRGQKSRGSVTNRSGTDWISAVYDALCAAARDECPDEGILDRIFESYRVSERDVRSAFEDYRKLSSGVRSRVFRPAVMKTMMELVALAHRRRVLGLRRFVLTLPAPSFVPSRPRSHPDRTGSEGRAVLSQ